MVGAARAAPAVTPAFSSDLRVSLLAIWTLPGLGARSIASPSSQWKPLSPVEPCGWRGGPPSGPIRVSVVVLHPPGGRHDDRGHGQGIRGSPFQAGARARRGAA